ncbi:hypothetical protein J3R83DRAFT_11615 [Lanmaoa asiatica]|nr:hypothetical protein J3R83DRAFT_11615 [Lanmaoa asiatica]
MARLSTPLCQVSRWFRAITHDSALWNGLYANAQFFCPPGPLPTVSFERALVQSARLTQSWTTQCLRTVSQVKIPLYGQITNSNLIDGRWLIMCQLDRRLVLFDTDDNAETRVAQVLWEQEEKITSWVNCHATSEEGQYVVHVLLSTEPQQWTLLEFRLNAESGVLCDTVALEIPVSSPYYYPEINRGRGPLAQSPFLCIRLRSWSWVPDPTLELVFDTRTRVLYDLPKFRVVLDEVRSRIDNRNSHFGSTIVVTNTHIIILRCYPVGMLLQAFTVPDNQRPVENKNGVLRLSHEGILQNQKKNFTVIRNSIVDPINGSISVRLVERRWEFNDAQPICIDLTLHRPSPVDVSPITIEQHSIIMTGNIPSLDDLVHCKQYHDISDNGYARGLLALPRPHEPPYHRTIVKFSIDATQDRCVAILGQPLHAGMRHVMYRINVDKETRWDASWDGVRGRLCRAYFDTAGPGFIVIVDIE